MILMTPESNSQLVLYLAIGLLPKTSGRPRISLASRRQSPRRIVRLIDEWMLVRCDRVS